jgi:hypothetical protein
VTENQELLLDKMVAAEIGKNWEGGPFHIAAEMLPGKPIDFSGNHGQSRGTRAVAVRLGYPLALLEALQGVVYLINAEEDRRAFAIAIFRAIPPGIKRKARTSDVTWLASVSVTHRAHALVCPAPTCEVTTALAALQAAQTEAARLPVLKSFFKKRCATAGRDCSEAIQLTSKTSALDRTLHAARDCIRHYSTTGRVLYAGRAAREAARAAFVASGLEEAVSLSVELARLLGIETS